ncbi:lysophospholipid acyltransferase family protein [Novosphingobium sp. Leaf2]|uniref:lysophospholipid acyltransferase family protein n=1 Tax=Novosphingobium sp. Leaf2 TaxID=1735670 RepID=UPI0009ECC4C7|nr:lysophospholipid acyltransferase family protein [Novosphingobium sp. Leaf2]
MLAALVLGVIFYYTLAPFIRPNPVPPRFLASTGAIAGLRVQVRGTPCPGRAFFLANHVSWLDILAIAGTTGSAFVAHDGLAGIGPLRWLCDMNGTVFVARHDRRSIAEQVEAVRRSMDDDRALTIFPEGTTSDGTGTLPFKSSLLSALTNYRDVPIQPIRLDYGKDTQEIAWAGEESGLKNAFRILARLRPVRLTVHFLAPLSGDALADRKRMAAAARAAIDITAPR